MPVEIIMPKVDMDMASGKLMVWHVDEGARVEKGAPLFDIETDKAAMEVEAEAAGFVHHRAPVEAEIAIGQPVAWLYADGEDVGPQPETRSGAGTDMPLEDAAAPEQSAAAHPDPGTDKIRATPSARRAAVEAGLALESVQGSGPRGRVQESDVSALLDQRVSRSAIAPTNLASECGALAITQRHGTGVPLIMLHGFAADAMSWATLDPNLSGRHTIRIDLPCHGKSPLVGLRDFAALAREVRHAIDGLHLDVYDLVGHSLGGALALSVADTRPRQLGQLSLIAPAGLGPEINAASLTGLNMATRPDSLAPWLRTFVNDETIITDAFVRLALAARPEPLRTAQTAMAESLFPDGVQAFDLRGALSRLTTPTRIIWGKRDRIIPWKHALRAPGDVALHLFENMGHIPHLEAPDAIGRILAKPL